MTNAVNDNAVCESGQDHESGSQHSTMQVPVHDIQNLHDASLCADTGHDLCSATVHLSPSLYCDREMLGAQLIY